LNALLEYVKDDGVSSILIERRDPYFTISKSKIKDLIIHDNPTGEVRVSYKSQMISTLNDLYFDLSEDSKLHRVFVEICLESIKEGEYLNKEALSFLNEIHKSIRG